MNQYWHVAIALTGLTLCSLLLGCLLVWWIWLDDIDNAPIPYPKWMKHH
jgi:hypothetical protein